LIIAIYNKKSNILLSLYFFPDKVNLTFLALGYRIFLSKPLKMAFHGLTKKTLLIDLLGSWNRIVLPVTKGKDGFHNMKREGLSVSVACVSRSIGPYGAQS